MSETRVVHVQVHPYDVYIGRTNTRYGLVASVWANPFKLGIRGKVLACWCKPRPCYGDVLAELADQQHAAEQGVEGMRGE